MIGKHCADFELGLAFSEGTWRTAKRVECGHDISDEEKWTMEGVERGAGELEAPGAIKGKGGRHVRGYLCIYVYTHTHTRFW